MTCYWNELDKILEKIPSELKLKMKRAKLSTTIGWNDAFKLKKKNGIEGYVPHIRYIEKFRLCHNSVDII